MLANLFAFAFPRRGQSQNSAASGLVPVDFPSPSDLRGGWAALAAVMSARGWGDEVFATDTEWHFHDGGGNWATLRFFERDRAVLIGQDHEYSETYFGDAAQYFGEEETDLLMDAPDWWQQNLAPGPHGEWLGFIYGWDGTQWQRASYDKEDGFTFVNLAGACSLNDLDYITQHSFDAPGLADGKPDAKELQALVAADAQVTEAMLNDAVPGWDSAAGAVAARNFLKAPV